MRTADGIAKVIIDFPPVNALPVQGWRDLRPRSPRPGPNPRPRTVILAAEGRGFCAGVDIKEMQRTEGHEALIGANQGCFAAFAAVYDCPVPVIAAVHGFCLGGGVGLAGNADIVIAADDATFGLPVVDRGALGAATHLARLVPQPADAGHGLHVPDRHRAPTAELRHRARGGAANRAARGRVAAPRELLPRTRPASGWRSSLNGIDPVDVKRSYRYEQGFTFELNLAGAGDKARQAFVDGPCG